MPRTKQEHLEIAKGLEKSRRRILVEAERNIPSSRLEFERFPPRQFPIRLHFLFSSKESRLLQNLRAVLSEVSKDKARYRKKFNRYTNGISFKCYFKDVAAMQPVVKQLHGENLWNGNLFQDKRVTPPDLLEQARQNVPSSPSAIVTGHNQPA
jgi:hypothetical protein